MNIPPIDFDEPIERPRPAFNQAMLTSRDGKKPKRTVWDGMFSNSKLKKPNTVAVIFLRNNGKAEPMEVESKKGFFSIYGKTYNEDTDCTYSLGKDKIPLAIIPEWSLIPYGTKKWHDKPMLEKFGELQDHTLRGIRHAELVKMGEKEGFNFNVKTIIILAILGVIGYALFSSYL